MLTETQVSQYLARIGFDGSVVANLDTLRALHKAHMHHVPFENLSIHIGEAISLDLDDVFHKLVVQRRGGFCYELNSLFHALLCTLGFKVKILSGQVFNGETYSAPFSHLLLLLDIAGQQLIADVGYGDSFTEGLPLDGTPMERLGTWHKVERQGETFTLMQDKGAEGYKAQYRFTLATYDIDAFKDRCHFQQSSPDSPFTQRSICTIATDDGRNSISSNRFIQTVRGVRSERTIEHAPELKQLLLEYFGIRLADDAPLDNLLALAGVFRRL
ncbi:arylamine N-acetyltransferase family protein [Dyella tabacisoli]|uniref:Arylamine N-acetyltransferase n=1 Tax=Dyella tabacisoli TaxID=2282381 RepID=A0A369UQX5_9GAMM|nr:arylamine N-acetyltransferase [Dyella tabacisoli]RDD82867.1 arylamine N-acetyltransferase [Dyella tabacisoli]